MRGIICKYTLQLQERYHLIGGIGYISLLFNRGYPKLKGEHQRFDLREPDVHPLVEEEVNAFDSFAVGDRRRLLIWDSKDALLKCRVHLLPEPLWDGVVDTSFDGSV